MGYFSIEVAGSKVEVRYGKIVRKRLFFDLLRKGKDRLAPRTGYIVHMEGPDGNQEYRFLKSAEGEWLSVDDGAFIRGQNGDMSDLIKKSIDEYESRMNR